MIKKRLIRFSTCLLLGLLLTACEFEQMSQLSTPTRSPMTPTPTPLAGSWIRPSDEMIMIEVGAGEFQMGSDDDDIDAALQLCNSTRDNCSREWFEDEGPVRTIRLDEYLIDRTEVTNAQYRQCVEDGSCQAPTTCGWGEPTYDDPSKAEHPVVCVSWNDAAAYCAWAGARLPTEAEWEKAARGTDRRVFPWGDSFEYNSANYCDSFCPFAWGDGGIDAHAQTAPAKSYWTGASPYGVLNMSGNVWEWVADWYTLYPDSEAFTENPKGLPFGTLRVVRGGSWTDSPNWLRSAERLGDDPKFSSGDRGFRCALSSPPQ